MNPTNNNKGFWKIVENIEINNNESNKNFQISFTLKIAIGWLNEQGSQKGKNKIRKIRNKLIQVELNWAELSQVEPSFDKIGFTKKMQNEKGGVTTFFSQKSKVWTDIGSWDHHTWWRSKILLTYFTFIFWINAIRRIVLWYSTMNITVGCFNFFIIYETCVIYSIINKWSANCIVNNATENILACRKSSSWS